MKVGHLMKTCELHACLLFHTQVKAAIMQLMVEGSCALNEDKLEQLQKMLPSQVRERLTEEIDR